MLMTWTNSRGEVVNQDADFTDDGIIPIGSPRMVGSVDDRIARSDGYPKKCGTCHRATLTRWAGIWWWGKPIVKRIRVGRRFPFVRLADSPGCGCLVLLKEAWVAVRETRRMLRRHESAGRGRSR